jgi:hypothetical protein
MGAHTLDASQVSTGRTGRGGPPRPPAPAPPDCGWQHRMQRRARGARRAPRGHSAEIPQDDASGWPAAAPGTRSKLLDGGRWRDPTARKSTPRVSATTHNMCRLHPLGCDDLPAHGNDVALTLVRVQSPEPPTQSPSGSPTAAMGGNTGRSYPVSERPS